MPTEFEKTHGDPKMSVKSPKPQEAEATDEQWLPAVGEQVRILSNKVEGEIVDAWRHDSRGDFSGPRPRVVIGVKAKNGDIYHEPLSNLEPLHPVVHGVIDTPNEVVNAEPFEPDPELPPEIEHPVVPDDPEDELPLLPDEEVAEIVKKTPRKERKPPAKDR